MMPKKVFLSFLAAGLLLGSTACDRKIDSDDARVSDAKEVADVTNADVTLQVDTAQSSMQWVGAKVTGRHPGKIDLKSGTVQLKDGQIAGGKFVFDMKSLRSVDDNQGNEENAKLTGHLKSADFFDVQKYPEAVFEIVSVTPATSADTTMNLNEESSIPKDRFNKYRILEATHNITGNLTLKDVTKSITFPAKIDASGNLVTARANFNIDRNDWKLNYGTDKSMGDKLIYSVVNIGFQVVAKP